MNKKNKITKKEEKKEIDMDKVIDAFKKEKWSYFKKVYGFKPKDSTEAEALIQKRLDVLKKMGISYNDIKDKWR